MYTTCLFCSSSLGTNDAIDSFPVGSRVAFDARKGRLWAVCRRCGRWNLAPIEERWEAVEAAERIFVDTRSRVQSQNIGLARLRDGTRLVRVGPALPGELAAWRYGGELISRRNRNMLLGGAGVLVGGAALAGLPLVIAAGLPAGMFSTGLQIAAAVQTQRERRKIVHRVVAADSPTGTELIIRRRDLFDASLLPLEGGAFGIELPEVQATRVRRWSDRTRSERPAVRLTGAAAHNVVSRAMILYNQSGAKPAEVAAALRSIEDAGGAEAFAHRAASSHAVLSRAMTPSKRGGTSYSVRQVISTFRGEILPVVRYRDPFRDDRPRLARTDALALEMALHEEAERRALHGELAALEAAWREAEEIAGIADALPGNVDS